MSEKTDTPITDECKFQLIWRDGAYYVNKPNIGSLDVVPADKMADLERQLAEARVAFAVVTDELVVEQSAHRRTRVQRDRLAEALDDIRSESPAATVPQWILERIDEALATLERKEEG